MFPMAIFRIMGKMVKMHITTTSTRDKCKLLSNLHVDIWTTALSTSPFLGHTWIQRSSDYSEGCTILASSVFASIIEIDIFYYNPFPFINYSDRIGELRSIEKPTILWFPSNTRRTMCDNHCALQNYKHLNKFVWAKLRSTKVYLKF